MKRLAINWSLLRNTLVDPLPIYPPEDATMAFIERVITGVACGTLAFSLFSSIPARAQVLVVATVGSQAITEQDLEARTAVKLTAQQNEHEIRLRQLDLGYSRSRHEYKERELDALVDEQVLSLEANARKTTSERLLAAAIKAPPITDTQMHDFYASQKSQINQPYDDVAGKIKEYLEKNATDALRRKYLNSLRATYHAAISLEPLRETVAAVGPVRGPANAAVTIIEFSDFQCPFCGRFEPVMKRVLAKYPTQVRLIYRHSPLSALHPAAQKAAEAAVCAQNQGKFWELHDLLFAEPSSLSIDALKEKAKRLDLNTAVFNDCLDSGKAVDAVAIDTHAAEQLGITGTPTSFINGRYKNGAVTETDIESIVDDELRQGASKVKLR